MAAVHERMLRKVKLPTLLDVFALWPIEAGVAGAGVVPDGLNTLSLLATGRVLAGGCVAQRPLALGAGLIVPLARGRVAFDVDLHAVLVVPLVVGLVVGPVLSLLCESLIGSHPGPLIIDFSDPNPVVGVEVWDDIVEVSDFILVLDGH